MATSTPERMKLTYWLNEGRVAMRYYQINGDIYDLSGGKRGPMKDDMIYAAIMDEAIRRQLRVRMDACAYNGQLPHWRVEFEQYCWDGLDGRIKVGTGRTRVEAAENAVLSYLKGRI